MLNHRTNRETLEKLNENRDRSRDDGTCGRFEPYRAQFIGPARALVLAAMIDIAHANFFL
jgi:hypothetical protein